jgi:hypothetical protein
VAPGGGGDEGLGYDLTAVFAERRLCEFLSRALVELVVNLGRGAATRAGLSGWQACAKVLKEIGNSYSSIWRIKGANPSQSANHCHSANCILAKICRPTSTASYGRSGETIYGKTGNQTRGGAER